MKYPIYKCAKALNEFYCMLDESYMCYVRDGLNGFFTVGVCEDREVIKLMMRSKDSTEQEFYKAMRNATSKVDTMADRLGEL